MDPVDLERLIDRELKRLAAPRAPATLLPRVMHAAAASGARRSRPRPWTAWPRVWQATSLAIVAVAAFAIVWWWPALQLVAAEVGRFAIVASAIVRVAQPIALAALVLVLIMAIACAIGGAALRHVAFGEAGQS